ncbi:MAG: toll/interleukin-1 receptor domain-containing protein [Anaerolineae bacterium]|nr:toll/interleukin-1 receptor domain-containing protein [Anaerolineae bacterium]
MKLFISYSSQNRDIVTGLADDLEELVKTLYADSEFQVWFDQELVGGHDWWDDILNAIEECDLFIFSLSADALDSEACKREVDYASQLDKRILPVLLTNDVDTGFLPGPLRRIQWVDYRERETKTANQNLLKGLVNLPKDQPIPAVKPKRPDAPVSPLAALGEQITSPTLDLQTQATLVHELKQYFHQPKYSNQARMLLQRLRQHPDLRASIGQEIVEILDAAPAQSHLQPQRQQAQNRPAANIVEVTPKQSRSGSHWPQILGAIIGFVIGLAFGADSAAFWTTDVLGYPTLGIDYFTLCGTAIIFALLGWGGGWLYVRARSR